MKVLKIIIGIVVALIAIFVVMGIMAPKETTIERSISISAPANVVWNNVKSLEAQHDWSPWARRDPNITITYDGIEGQVGSKYTWKGNKDVGEGYQSIIAVEDGHKIEQDLNFTGEWESHADVWLTVEPAGEEQKVTWGFHTEYGFVSATFMMMMDMDGYLSKDFDEGLGYLKEICEKQAAAAPADKSETFEVDGFTITEKEFGPKTYLSHKETVKFADLPAFFAKHYGEIMAAVLGAGYELDGMPSAIYYNWDVENEQTEVAAAIPVKGLGIQMDGFTTITVHPGLACQVEYYGVYDSLGNVHMALEKHMNSRTITGSIAIEEYVTDPSTETDPSKILTLVTYPLGTVE